MAKKHQSSRRGFRKNFGRLAAATASLAAAQQARAQVVHVPFHGVVPAGALSDIDVDGDATPDLRIDATSFPIVLEADPLHIFNARIVKDCSWVPSPGTTTNPLPPPTPGVLVHPFGAGEAISGFDALPSSAAMTDSPPVDGFYNTSTPRFAGFEIYSYGMGPLPTWVELNITPNHDVQVIGFGYESSPFVPIIAGDTGGTPCDREDPLLDCDFDGIPMGIDNCPLISNPLQEDSDGDGIGDSCDQDHDQDGVIDRLDDCPASDPARETDAHGRPIGDVDGDCEVNGLDIQRFVDALLGL